MCDPDAPQDVLEAVAEKFGGLGGALYVQLVAVTVTERGHSVLAVLVEVREKTPVESGRAKGRGARSEGVRVASAPTPRLSAASIRQTKTASAPADASLATRVRGLVCAILKCGLLDDSHARPPCAAAVLVAGNMGRWPLCPGPFKMDWPRTRFYLQFGQFFKTSQMYLEGVLADLRRFRVTNRFTPPALTSYVR